MTLAADEFRAHLELSAATAGIALPEIVLPDERHLLLERMRFHYLDWGTPGLPPVVFLHGGGLNAHTWDLVCLALRRERHCVALDQRGHGESEWSPEMNYAIESHVGDLDRFVEALGLERFVLVGMSLGGANALAWAGRHSARLAGLVLVDVGPETRAEGVKKIAAFTSESTPLDSVDEFIERALAFNPRRNRELLRRSLLHNLRRMPDGRYMWKYDQRHRGKVDPGAHARRRELLWSAVDGVECPTLVVRGAQSDVFHDEDAERLAGRFRQRPLGQDRGRRPHRAGRQPGRPPRRAPRLPRRGRARGLTTGSRFPTTDPGSASQRQEDGMLDLGLDGKVAIITGGSDGLGRAAAERLAREGARVAICGRRKERLEQAADGIRKATGGQILAQVADVSRAADIEALVAATVAQFGGLDILVNNAGQSAAGGFETVSDEAWQSDIDLKLMGAVRCCRLAIPHMKRRGGGRIINITNLGGKAPAAKGLPTSVTRAAGINLTKSLANEYAPDKILVNTICVGFVKSGQWERRAQGKDLDAFYREAAKSVPVGRVGEADEFADLVAFLVSARAGYITGTAVNFDGGRSAVVYGQTV